MFHISRFALFVCAGSVLLAAPPEPAVTAAKAALAQLPLRFEENRGQWNSAVRYAARSGGYNLQLTARGAALSMGRERVEIGLVNANPSSAIEPLDRIAAPTNYFVGPKQQWRAGVATYARVRYRAVYPGIDIVYYGNQNQLEYDFVLQPGADPNRIRMKFRGAVRVSITPEGDLALEAGGTRALQRKPVVYQDYQEDAGTGVGTNARHAIAGRYTMLAHNVVGFRLARYDRTRPLVIDPILVYCAYMGSSGADQIAAIKLDSKGLLYIAGSTNTGELAATDGAYKNVNTGLTDIFVAIIDTSANGNFALTYFTYLGGANQDIPRAMDVDSKGVVYLTGTTNSSDFPIVGAAVQTTGAASTVDAFVAILDTTVAGVDSFQYSTFLGGSDGNDSGNGIAVDKDGMIYVIGTTRSTNFPATSSAYAGQLYGTQDAFLCKIDSTNPNFVYATYLGGESNDDGRSIALGTNGLVYFAATTISDQFPMEGPGYRQQRAGAIDIILGVMDMRLSGTASLKYSTYFGGSDVDEVRKIALDAKNNVLLTGYTLSTDFPATPDAVYASAQGNGDVFVSVLNPNDPANFLVYSTYFGGSQGEVAYDIAGDSGGNIHLTGYTLSPDLFTRDAPQPGWGGGINLFIAKLKPGVAGTSGILACTYFGSTGVYVGNSLAIGPDGSVYVGGYGNIGLPGSNGYSGGSTDGFIIVIK